MGGHEPFDGCLSESKLTGGIHNFLGGFSSKSLIDRAQISALYKDPTRVPDSVAQLMRSQHIGSRTYTLNNYNKMSYDELLGVLQRIARSSITTHNHPPYALTADNLLKMVLVVS